MEVIWPQRVQPGEVGAVTPNVPVINATYTIAQVDPESYKTALATGSGIGFPLPFEYANNYVLAMAGFGLPWYFREGAGTLRARWRPASATPRSTLTDSSFLACLTEPSNAGKSILDNARAVYAIDGANSTDKKSSWLQVYGYSQVLPKADSAKLALQYPSFPAGIDFSGITCPDMIWV